MSHSVKFVSPNRTATGGEISLDINISCIPFDESNRTAVTQWLRWYGYAVMLQSTADRLEDTGESQ